MNKIIKNLQSSLAKDFTTAGLKLLLIGAGMLIIILALLVDEPWQLAGILAWILLP